MVGGNLDEGNPRLPDVQRDELHIPYLFAEKGIESVWKISSSTYNIAERVEKYIDDVYSQTYTSKEYVDSSFLDIDGSNAMLGPIKLNDSSTNTVLTLSTVGLDNSTNSIHIIDGSVSITAAEMISLSTDNEIEIGTTASKIYIGDSSYTDVSIHGKHVDVFSEEDLLLQSNEKSVYIEAENDVHIDSATGDIKLNAGNKQKGITLDASYMYINGMKFNPPDENIDVSHMLAVTKTDDGSVEMTWNKIGGMKILKYNTPLDSSEFNFIDTAEHNILSGACISFSDTSGHQYTTVGSANVSDINIATIGGKTLDGAHNIDVMTINGKPTVGQNDSLSLVTDSSFNDYKGDVVHFTSGTPNGNSFLIIKSNGSEGYKIEEITDITISGGNLSAKAFIMSSDRNLKTDIREDCFEKEMPSLHGFKWKDSSVQSYGFIAQELEEGGFGHLVTEHDGIKGVDYMAALSYKVAQLERENEMLWDAIHDMQQKLK
jgi:hypothetical protein